MIHAWYAHHCEVPLPEGHRFPMQKYELLYEQLLYEGHAVPEVLQRPQLIDEALILAVHEAAYWQRVKQLALTAAEQRRLGLPHSAGLLARVWTSTSGTVAAALRAHTHRAAMNLAGGTHHAYADRCEGFCVLNDVAVAARHLLAAGLATRVLVVDLDVHQGNGTAHIFAAEPRVHTYSVHCATNYPAQKEASDTDVALPPGTTDEAYLKALADTLPRVWAHFGPDFVFYIAGADVLATDKLGNFALSKEGCAERDRMVIERAYKNGVPLAVVLGGGYSPRLTDVVAVHTRTYALLNHYFAS